MGEAADMFTLLQENKPAVLSGVAFHKPNRWCFEMFTGSELTSRVVRDSAAVGANWLASAQILASGPLSKSGARQLGAVLKRQAADVVLLKRPYHGLTRRCQCLGER